jgi:predicted small secreted protein
MLFSAAHARKRLLLAAFGCLCLTACNTVRGFGQDLSRGGEALAQAATEAQADVEQPAPANANAPIPIERARVAALTNRPGTITHEHFQPGADGNGARYVFDILDDGAAYTVGIDARTGAVLENTPRY